MANPPTLLGTVQDVRGATVSVALEKETASGLAFIDGHGYRIGQLGSFVRIAIGLTDLFGIVSQAGAGAAPDAMAVNEPFGLRWLRVQIIGESARGATFRRGVSQFPTIGDEVHLVTDGDLSRIYGKNDSPRYARIGSLASADSLPALVDLNRLISRHSAVVGSTGAGKSTTVAGLLGSISEPSLYPSARIIVFDIHGEYYRALEDRATVFRVAPDEARGEKSLFVPFWALSFDEFLRVTPFAGIGDTDRSYLAEKVKQLKFDSLTTTPRKGIPKEAITVDSPVPFSIHRLWYELHRDVNSTHTAQATAQSSATEAIEVDSSGGAQAGNIMSAIPPKYKSITAGGPNRIYLSASPHNIRRHLLALGSQLRDTRYDFLLRPGPWCPMPDFANLNAPPEKDLDELLNGWVGSPKPITILDLSGVPEAILSDLIGVLLRLLFDAFFWGRNLQAGARQRPALLVLEEAHSYLSPSSGETALLAARKIVKEGRKYGLGAMVVSQRPSEVDSTILSQCGTMIAMRLANPTDRGQVASMATDNLEGLFDMLPALRTGEAIVVGESVQLPLRAIMDYPPVGRRPESDDPDVVSPDSTKGWTAPRQREDYSTVIELWRATKSRPTTEDNET